MGNWGINSLERAGENALYLKPGVKLEPLVFGWYAWPHLISPASLALNMAFRHQPLCESFLRNPAIHVAAMKDPALYGGPYLEIEESGRAQVASLLADTNTRAAPLLQFAQALRQLQGDLHSKATGASLNDAYGRLADPLRGCVELVYDGGHRPHVRLFEELLYASGLTGAAGQQIDISLAPETSRAFFLSTPRLARPEAVRLDMPFDHAAVTTLAQMRTVPGALADVATALNADAQTMAALRPFFTEEPPPRRDTDFSEDGLRVRYFGHACILIQTREVNILLDPVLSWDDGYGDRHLNFLDLPDRIDIVIISHNHQDHLCPELLMQLRHRIGRVIVPANNPGCPADPSIALLLRSLGFRDIVTVNPLDRLDFPGGFFASLPFTGEHADLDIYSKQAILIEILGRRLVFLVDSDGVDPVLYDRVAAVFGRADILFLGMECHGAPLTWLYGPLLSRPISRRDDESRRLSGSDAARAKEALARLGGRQVFVYAMGQEPWLRYLMGLQYGPDSIQLSQAKAFVDWCNQSGTPCEQLFGGRDLELVA